MSDSAKLDNQDDDLVRARCIQLIYAMPSRGLEETIEELAGLMEFYSGEHWSHPDDSPGLTITKPAKITVRRDRAPFVLAEDP